MPEIKQKKVSALQKKTKKNRLKKIISKSKKSQIKKEINRFSKLEKKYKRKQKLQDVGKKGFAKINWAGGKTKKILDQFRQIIELPRKSILKFKARKDKKGIIIMNSHFIDELQQKTKDQNYKGKWIKLNPPKKHKKTNHTLQQLHNSY
ncbi:hypothetical protein CMI37_19415 [Candidatus Pacearchaeota archaeon]|nr:hypothetical protein [Candidatus Pacearchaeota archaeon]|tara:strand:- start:834 stop:1280 length:447 start_codon:yes stop_codon:yes gene_type:complete